MFQEFGQVTPNIAMVNSYLVYIPMVFIYFRSIKNVPVVFIYFHCIHTQYKWCYLLIICMHTAQIARVFPHYDWYYYGLLNIFILGHEYWSHVVVELLVTPAWTIK